MKKIGIIIDSFSGFTKKEIEKMNLNWIGQIVILDNKEYSDGEGIITKNALGVFRNAKTFKSSMPPLGEMVDLFEKMSKEFENVVFIPINKGLSATYSSAVAATSEIKNIHVIDQKLCGSAIIQGALEAKEMVERGKSIKETIDYILSLSQESHCFVIPKDVSSLVRGGRLKGVKKFILEKTKMIPLLYVGPEGFTTMGVKKNFVRTLRFAVKKAIIKIGGEKFINDYNWEILSAGDEDSIKKAQSELKDAGILKVAKNWVAGIVTGHAGIGAVGINAYKKAN